MISLIFISLYMIVSLIILGKTRSLSDTHYGYVRKYGKHWVFPLAMSVWSLLVILEHQESTPIILAALGVFYVGACAAFRQDGVLKVKHYLSAFVSIVIIAFLVYHLTVLFWIAVGLSGLSLFSKYRIYIIELIWIITFYIFVL